MCAADLTARGRDAVNRAGRQRGIPLLEKEFTFASVDVGEQARVENDRAKGIAQLLAQ